MPRTVLCPLPFSFRKGSAAALIARVTEHRGRPGRARERVKGATAEYVEHRGSTEGAHPSTARAHRERCPNTDLQKPVQA